MFRICFIGFLSLFLITACSAPHNNGRTTPYDPYKSGSLKSQTIFNSQGQIQSPQPSAPQHNMMQGANGTVALLLPLSGSHSTVGQSMLEAAQLALFDIRDSGLTLMPYDTKGTPSGTADAVQQAASGGAKIILGPLLGDNVQTAGIVARQHNLQVIGFTTDRSKISNNIVTLGILPADQGSRAAQYLAQSGMRRIVVIDPKNDYSRAVIQAFESKARALGLQITTKIPYDNANQSNDIAARLSQNKSAFDALFMPIGKRHLMPLAQSLTQAGLGAGTVPWIGSGLWDDQAIQGNSLFSNALYPAPSQELRRPFEQQYRSMYGKKPQRLASLAYDAVALSAVLLRENGRFVNYQSLLNPHGFSGIDGIFRFQNNGLAERGLAVHRIIGRGRTSIVAPSPSSFSS